ncbi:uncharacterized protein C8Q71DRAFT_563595 [Rhodofomes roseus]|uniref:Uncharacterized protein n=1 Tax=Rhodofomes roseus TaxID=34475 RepID=A0ABQ8KIP4_9APHY|nr:uncharacterized protein C8Q71DRAFT_563595 [Rhodofomes roseus]KAH9837828.1 hypothetical protein C8Q71DRAFT_563595 [Rhodofomes roseus]
MLALLSKLFTGTKYPSAMLVVDDGSRIYAVHLVPEEPHLVEEFGIPSQPIFRREGTREQRREEIGTVALNVDKAEEVVFGGDMAERVRKLWEDKLRKEQPPQQSGEAHPTGTSVDVACLVSDVLRPAALEAISEWEGRPRSEDATRTCSVYVVYVNRPTPEPILLWKTPTSIAG